MVTQVKGMQVFERFEINFLDSLLDYFSYVSHAPFTKSNS